MDAQQELDIYKQADLDKNLRIQQLETAVSQLKLRPQTVTAGVQTDAVETAALAAQTDQASPEVLISRPVQAECERQSFGSQASFSKSEPPCSPLMQKVEIAPQVVEELGALKHALIRQELRLMDMTKVLAKDANRTRLVSSVLLDKVFEIQDLKLAILYTLTKNLDQQMDYTPVYKFSREKMSFNFLRNLTRGRSVLGRIAIIEEADYLERDFGGMAKSRDGRLGFSSLG
ncbi:hypothetical protein SS50377_25983 [Spironucleus salmonicida]|uniref:Uncharacterized protein n=2 Tax=Spironucleus salmonicida TaxID=348837 RepID=V6LHR2_9EUKA|nr:hypothetical protein SS50377_25983 [Spironucleus salmonicida]|eukprot:EST43231.1 Hypothetical protein SS50377_17096 [Spironucleus salmonicida]